MTDAQPPCDPVIPAGDAPSPEPQPNAIAYFVGVVLQAATFVGSIWIVDHVLVLGAGPNASRDDGFALVFLVLGAAACLIVVPAAVGAACMHFGSSGRWPTAARLARSTGLIGVAAVLVGVFNAFVS